MRCRFAARMRGAFQVANRCGRMAFRGQWKRHGARRCRRARRCAARRTRNASPAIRWSRDVQLASRFPAGSRSGALVFQAVPGREDLVLYRYAGDYPVRRGAMSADGRSVWRECGVSVEVQLGGVGRTATFWRRLKERTGGVPGQKDSWRGPSQWTVHRTYRCPIPHSGRWPHRPSERHPHARYVDPRRFWRKIRHLACAVLGTDDITKDDAYVLVNSACRCSRRSDRGKGSRSCPCAC